MAGVDTQTFLDVCLQNPMVGEVLERAETVELPDWYLAAGCLQQTVWNVLDGHSPGRGINDYDLIYFDDSDLSWDAEDEVIRACEHLFADLPVDVEVRNQARVHLWYEDHFGVATTPLNSSAEAIDRYACHACQLAIRRTNGTDEVYAPNGFDDVFNFTLRPNPMVAPRSVYETKTTRWKALWPRLTIHPWPDDTIPASQ